MVSQWEVPGEWLGVAEEWSVGVDGRVVSGSGWWSGQWEWTGKWSVGVAGEWLVEWSVGVDGKWSVGVAGEWLVRVAKGVAGEWEWEWLGSD